MRTVRFLLFVTLAVGVLALGFPRQAQAYSWGTVTVDANGYLSWPTSVAVDTDGDPMISYGYDEYPNGDLKFAICDRSVSANGNCDQAGDWSTITVDSQGSIGESSIAVDANRNPMISYFDDTIPYDGDLKFAVCDRLASMNGNCNQIGDWDTLTVEAQGDVGWYLDITVDSAGSPMISYADMTDYPDWDLKFAACDRSGSVHGNCDQVGDWTTTTVEAAGNVGVYTSIAVDGDDNPMISYLDGGNDDLKFAFCDRSASASGECDQPGDWNTVGVDSQGHVGYWTSIVTRDQGDPMISYQGDGELKFAICVRAASINGNCDQTADWNTVSVETAQLVEDTSIAVNASGDPMIAYGRWYYQDSDLVFTACDRSASTTGDCDEQGDWSAETVDTLGDVGYTASIAVDGNSYPMISYHHLGDDDLKFAIGSLVPATPTPPAATETATAVPPLTATLTATAQATSVTTASPTPVVTGTPTRTPTSEAFPGASPTPTEVSTPAAAPPTGAGGPPSSRFPWWAFLVASGLAATGVAGLVILKRSQS